MVLVIITHDHQHILGACSCKIIINNVTVILSKLYDGSLPDAVTLLLLRAFLALYSRSAWRTLTATY